MDELRRQLYESYRPWKDRMDVPEDAVYGQELERARLLPNARVYEVGFGAGRFLDWAQRSGYECSGCEVVSDYVESARARGHAVQLGSFLECMPQHGELDLIVMLDVAEHLSKQELVDGVRVCEAALRPGGGVLLRVPNGGSPFGRAFQHGDLTHKTVLTPSSLSQLVAGSRIELEGAWNAARGRELRSLRSLFKPLAYVARDLVELAVGYCYYGERIPMDPNLTAVLRKR